MMTALKKRIRNFRRREGGSALVEFAIFLPIMTLTFAIIVEFSRIFLSYQAANVGVRDAARYLARVTDANICITLNEPTETVTIAGATDAEAIIRINMNNENDLLPEKVVLDSIKVTLDCVDGAPSGVQLYRQDYVPVVTVETKVSIILPFKNMFAYIGIGGRLGSEGVIPGTISDSSRVYGV